MGLIHPLNIHYWAFAPPSQGTLLLWELIQCLSPSLGSFALPFPRCPLHVTFCEKLSLAAKSEWGSSPVTASVPCSSALAFPTPAWNYMAICLSPSLNYEPWEDGDCIRLIHHRIPLVYGWSLVNVWLIMTTGPCFGHWGREDELDTIMPALLGILLRWDWSGCPWRGKPWFFLWLSSAQHSLKNLHPTSEILDAMCRGWNNKREIEVRDKLQRLLHDWGLNWWWDRGNKADSQLNTIGGGMWSGLWVTHRHELSAGDMVPWNR